VVHEALRQNRAGSPPCRLATRAWTAGPRSTSSHFLGRAGKFQISSNGGAQPRWNKNGKEIFYVSLDSKMMAALVKLSTDGQSLETGTPAALFPVRIAGGPLPGVNKQQYAVSSDGQRFLVNLAVDNGAASPITLIYNWKPKP